jgi:hypothetical protein
MQKIFKKLAELFFKNISGDFAYLFFRKEGRVLMGRNYMNFVFLVLIFLITFFALGFAKGSLRYLSEKMDDPFIRWVSIDIPFSKADSLPEIIRSLQEDKHSQQLFEYRSVTGYRKFSLTFWDSKLNITRTFAGRTMDMGNPILNEVLKKDYRISGREFQNIKDLGLIVTSKFLKDLGYDQKTPYVVMAFPDKLNEDRFLTVPLPVIAVVRDLPGSASFFSTPFFYQERQHPLRSSNPFDPSITAHVQMLVRENQGRASEFKDRVRKFLIEQPQYKPYDPGVDIQPWELSWYPCYLLTITLLDDTSFTLRNRIFGEIRQDRDLSKYNFTRFTDYTTKVSNDEVPHFGYDKLVVELTSLGKVEEFKNFLLKRYQVPMDMSQVEALKNYNFISNLTKIISIILMIFSAISILLFLTNLLRNHLEQIKMNIGTFKAFGINHVSLEKIYLSIIYCFILVTLVIAFIINMAFGSLGGVRLILLIFGSPLEKGETYFDLINGWTLAAIVLVLIAGYFALKRTTGKIFRQTPGDLIYDRQESGKETAKKN